MRSTTRRMTTPVAIAAVSFLALAACSSDDEGDIAPPAAEAPAPEEAPEEEAPSEAESPSEEAPTEDAETAETETEDTDSDGDTGASEGGAPDWANPVTTVGESLGTFEVGDLTVEAFEVAVDQATRSSIWADPDTEEPIVAEGDDVVVLNYVVTNNGDPVNLTYGLVDIGLHYDTWPFMQQPSVADHTLLENHGVNDNAVNGDSISNDIFTLGTGEQFSIGQVMLHQPGEAYTIEADFAPRDEAGERLGDTFEGELTGTMN